MAIKYYRLVTKSGKVLAKLQAEMEAHFAQLEAQEQVFEELRVTQKAGLEAALKNTRLAAAVTKAQEFAVLYYKQVKGGWLTTKEVELVVKGPPAKLARFEAYVRTHECSLQRGKEVTKGNLAFTLYRTWSIIIGEDWGVIKQLLQGLRITIVSEVSETATNINIDKISGNILGPVENVLTARDMLLHLTTLTRLRREVITFF